MSANAALAAATQRLRAAGVPDASRDARRLLAHALGVAPTRLTLHLADPMPELAVEAYEQAIARRARREPVSHITGTRAFWGRDFRVTGDVLDPRPETETLVDLALQAPFRRVLDLGTGSGCILLTLLAERPGAAGLGTDLSASALSVARDNAQRLGLTPDFVLSDWCAAVTGSFDLIVSNPPYIAAGEMAALSPEVRQWEPQMALTPGGDGLDAYRAIAAQAPALLCPKGRLMVEIGPTQGAAVSALFQDAGLENVTVTPDLDGRDRVVSGSKP